MAREQERERERRNPRILDAGDTLLRRWEIVVVVVMTAAAAAAARNCLLWLAVLSFVEQVRGSSCWFYATNEVNSPSSNK